MYHLLQLLQFICGYLNPLIKDIKMKIGALFQLGGVWIGCHYSEYNRRFCINIIPCVTIWVIKKGGKIPEKAKTTV